MRVYLNKGINILLVITILFITTNSLSNLVLNNKNNLINLNEENIRINNLPINYYQEGDGFPLLIIPDLISSNLDLKYIKNNLSQNNKLIILNTYELAKYFPENYSLNDLSDLIINFMDSLGYNKFNILALGANSNIPLNIAKNYTEHIDKIVISNPIEYTYKPSFKNMYLFQRYLYSKNYLNKSKLDKNIFEHNYFLLNNINTKSLYNYIDLVNKEVLNKSQITNEILILTSSSYIDYCNDLKLQLENSSLKEVLNCGKYIHIEASDLFSKEINNFLK